MVNVKEVDVSIVPSTEPGFEKLTSEVFFDNGQIVMETQGLEIRGSGSIETESGGFETLKIRAPIELCQLVVSPEQELTDEGVLYPKFEIADAVFEMHPDQFFVDVTGDLPLYKESRVEKEIK